MKWKYCIYLLPAFLLFCCICNPLSLYFLSDDFDSMLMAQTWKGILHSYRPGSDFLLHTDQLLYGYRAGGYHVTNYLLHFLTSFLLFFTSKQLLLPFYDKTTVEKYAFTASLIFLFYPFHSECIFWLVGRSSILAALFAMASIYSFIRKKVSNKWYAASLLCLMLGLFSYESIWTLPVIISMLALVYDKEMSTRRKLLYIGGYWLTFFSYLLVRLYLTNTVIGTPYGSQKIVSFNVPFLLRNGAGLLSRSFVPPMQSPVAFVACLCIMVIVLIVICFKIRNEITIPVLIFIIAYLLCLLPVLPIGIGTHDTESERVLYMPSTFLCILLSVALFALCKHVAVFAIAILLVVQSIFLVLSYKSFNAAGKVTKATIQTFQLIPQTDNIYCIYLPGQYNGGFIFRNGIVSAAQLFAPHLKSVHIISHQEAVNLKERYGVHCYSLNNLSAQLQTLHLPGKLTSNSAIFVWTDSSLNVYR